MNINVVYNNDRKFGELSMGDTFCCEGDLYVKTRKFQGGWEEGDDCTNAVRLNDGELEYFSDGKEVTRCDCNIEVII